MSEDRVKNGVGDLLCGMSTEAFRLETQEEVLL